MDPNLNTPEPIQVTPPISSQEHDVQTSPPPAHETKQSRKFNFTYILIALLILIIIVLFGVVFMSQNKTATPAPTPTPADMTGSDLVSPAEPKATSSADTADWKTHTGSEFSVRHDPTWQVNADNDFGATSIFDPNSWSEKIGQGGGGGVGGPSKYFTVQIIDSPLTVKQYIDSALTGAEYLSVKDPGRQSVNLDNYSGEIFKNSGEGSDGYIIVLSNNNGKLATINIPYASPSENKIIWNMLNTFKFK